MKSLLVIIPDHLSELINKGEITTRYYNPVDLFDEVHILMTNADRPDPEALRKTVGRATLHLHNLPADNKTFAATLAWRPALLNVWAARGVALAKQIQPDLIRCHGVSLNVYVAARIKKSIGAPYIVSLHGNPDVDYYRGRLATTFFHKLQGRAIEPIEIMGIKNADHVIAVYSPILPYLEKHGVKNYSLIYNIVGIGAIPKQDYSLAGPMKCISVGRQQSNQKDQSSIIEAVARLHGVALTLIGDGDLHHSLRRKAEQAGAADRITFIKAMPNTEILKAMHESDVYVYSSINYEISKTCIEAALTGLPVVHNDRNGQPAREISESGFLLVKGDAASYQAALGRLRDDMALRAEYGRAARAVAEQKWLPENVEARTVELYERVMREAGRAPRHG